MTSQVEQAIHNAKSSLQEKKVDYAFWHARTLQEKLRHHQGIVSQYLGEEWIKRICGETQPDISNPPQSQTAERIALVNQFSVLQEKFSQM